MMYTEILSELIKNVNSQNELKGKFTQFNLNTVESGMEDDSKVFETFAKQYLLNCLFDDILKNIHHFFE